MADPLFMHELAEHLHMTVGDLGRRASNHEVCVGWPLYFAYKERRAKAEEQQAPTPRRGRRG